MFLAKYETVYLLLMIVFSLLVSTSSFAVDKGNLSPIEKANFQPKSISSQMEDEDDEPTVENLLKAREAGDLEKASRIQAILNKKAKKSWRSPVGNESTIEYPYTTHTQHEDAFCRPHTWDMDDTICTGPVSGGISVDYDTGGNVYAVRCSTWNGVPDAHMAIYKSTDGGESWSWFAAFYSTLASYSYPVVLTGKNTNKVYLFYLYPYQNKRILMKRYSQSGESEGTYDVKLDTDSIPYYSACTDLGIGEHLMVVYERHEMGDNTPDLCSIVSTDQGETWSSEVKITEDGSHPDIAYGNDGYLYCVHEKTGGADTEIAFIRSSDYGASWESATGEYLTWDSYDDSYPKVAALHTLPADSAYVWVVYNHDDLNSGNIDLRYAYSTNGGKDWSKNQVLADADDYDEMACDLWTVPWSDGYLYINICYLKDKTIMPSPHSYIMFGWADINVPNWYYTIGINSHIPARSEDGREVCQGTYAQNSCAIAYAGWDFPYGDNFENLYFDNSAWLTDVDEEMTEGEVLGGFSLFANYPNPFNPSTNVRYTVNSTQIPLPTTLKIYNIRGQLVRTLVNEPQEAGTYEVIWDGRDENDNEVASGIYFYRLKAGDFVEARKMLLLK